MKVPTELVIRSALEEISTSNIPNSLELTALSLQLLAHSFLKITKEKGDIKEIDFYHGLLMEQCKDIPPVPDQLKPFIAMLLWNIEEYVYDNMEIEEERELEINEFS